MGDVHGVASTVATCRIVRRTGRAYTTTLERTDNSSGCTTAVAVIDLLLYVAVWRVLWPTNPLLVLPPS